MQLLKDLYISFTGSQPKTTEVITGSGSNRQYVRFTSAEGRSIIGVVGTSVEENRAFCYLADHFTAAGLPVPAIFATSADGLRYLQADLGSRSLFDALRNGREAGGYYDDAERQLLRRTISELPRLQILGARGLDFSVCYPQAEMDVMNVLFDLNYFKYCFLKPVASASGQDFHEVRLEQDFRLLAADLLQSAGRCAAADEPSESMPVLPPAFLYRDFQARNVMLDARGNPHFIDFQGGRRGPIEYDLASFLWQASARYPSALREELIRVYLLSLRQVLGHVSAEWQACPDDAWSHFESTFRSRLRRFVLFRQLQVLGAYGFRGYFERKEHFLTSIPPALENLRALLKEEDSCPYLELRQALVQITSQAPSPPVAPPVTPSQQGRGSGVLAAGASVAAAPALRVRVFSFSYKRGIPADESGNGGGYVFDCRSTHNPGRYEPYKHLTGLDEPVIRFLEDDGEILSFLQSVYRLADAHVERYLQRGFTDLMFAFGCTGGQHRSVYCAQHLAEHLHAKYGIAVDLHHREQHIHSELR